MLFAFGIRFFQKHPIYVIALLFGLLCSSAVTFGAEETDTGLKEKDCAKCHMFQLKVLNDWGGRHRTEVGCLDCHPQHPPEGEETIKTCTSCHFDRPHFQISGCLDCHVDPHKPLAALQDTIKPARVECLSCHAEVGEKMSASPSKHAKLFCTKCHNRHGFVPSCLDCHSPHLSDQGDPECLRCHKAHRPLKIVPAGWIPETYCMVCHEKEARALAETRTNHGGIICTFCHKGQHPSVPTCQECHGLPHDQRMHSKFRGCLSDCHGDAHRLLSNR